MAENSDHLLIRWPLPEEEPVGPVEFESAADAFNRRVAASGKLDRIERWQITGDEGHA